MLLLHVLPLLPEQSERVKQQAEEKLRSVQTLVEADWKTQASATSRCNEFLFEGCVRLRKPSARSKQSERYAFLFDKLLILCKANARGAGALNPLALAANLNLTLRTAERAEPLFRLKNLFDIFKLHITDREDTDGTSARVRVRVRVSRRDFRQCCVACACAELRNAFELQLQEQHHFILSTQTPDEKHAWMAALVGLQTARHADADATHTQSLCPPFVTRSRIHMFTCSPVHPPLCLRRLVGSSGSASPKSPRRSATCRFTCPRPPSTGTSTAPPPAPPVTLLHIVRVRYLEKQKHTRLLVRVQENSNN